MFERHQGGDRAILVHASIDADTDTSDVREFRELVFSTGTIILELFVARRHSADAKYFIGSGKVAELADYLRQHAADVVIFSNTLSPSQERNLEREFECRVLDRTGLILDIFAQRARSHEGKLQVELAQLRHLSTRLIRGWTHLERQKGGIGMRGPGEKQLETDRRLLHERIKNLLKRLEKVKGQREQGRQARRKAEIPTVSLVGYTNAGKSTLFNQISGAEVYAADQLFATLDPTLRRIELTGGLPLVLADTVGFIRHLPHDLVAAFRATLQETEEADLLLHVVDASDAQRDDNIDSVNQVLAEIDTADKPQLLVYNKIDRSGHAPRYLPAADGVPARVWLSAQTGEGVELLVQALSEFFQGAVMYRRVYLPMSAGKLRAALFQHGAVVSEAVDESGVWDLQLQLSRDLYAQLCRQYQDFPQLEQPGSQ